MQIKFVDKDTEDFQNYIDQLITIKFSHSLELSFEHLYQLWGNQRGLFLEMAKNTDVEYPLMWSGTISSGKWKGE